MTTQRPERRARGVALAGLVFQIGLAAFFAVLTVWSKSEAMRALTLLTAIGNVAWLFLVLVYHQRVLVREEAFETERLRRGREGATGTDAIFDVADEQLLLARRRLRWMYRWLLGAFTIVFIALLVGAGLAYWSWPLGQSLRAEQWAQARNTGLLIWFVGGAAFLSFLFSRYSTGMARQPEWRMLHAGAAYLMGVTLAAAALVAALGALHFFKTPVPERMVAYALRLLLLVLAGETTVNFVLDFYRPRAPDEEPRPAFDSRLLGLFTEPGGIARSIAEAINYQFGFEVSSTWFYKLLQRSVVPLIGFAVALMFAASGLVFVGADEHAVIERFGRRLEEDLLPGLHAKWPWPIETAYKVATAQVHELKIGIKDEKAPQEELILWTNKHSREPHLEVLVATPKLARFLNVGQSKDQGETSPERDRGATRPAEGAPEQGEAVPVSQLRVSVSLQYQIRDAYSWLRTYKDPEAMFEAIAKREIMRYCAGVDVAGLLGGERGPIERALGDSIQASAEDRQLGVDVVFLGLQGVHPPAETAEAFQDVIGAESKRTATVRSARADRNKVLSEVAGNIERAEQLALAIRRVNEFEADPNVPEAGLRAARKRVDRLFFGYADQNVRPAGGRASERIMQAREKRWELENKAHGKAAAFDAEITTRDAAPRTYRMYRYLDALAEATRGIRKYVMAAEARQAVQTFHLNLQDPRDIPFDVILEEQED